MLFFEVLFWPWCYYHSAAEVKMETNSLNVLPHLSGFSKELASSESEEALAAGESPFT